jgi:hypothetical protein
MKKIFGIGRKQCRGCLIQGSRSAFLISGAEQNSRKQRFFTAFFLLRNLAKLLPGFLGKRHGATSFT